MQTVSCPSCGAPVQFRSHAAVMAVCEFCRATVLKDADSVKDIGKMSSVLEDYSPIQIGTSGVAGQRGFTVVGRIQLRYSQGIWNEWFLLFDDASTAWLGDSSGLFTITTERTVTNALPRFEDIVPGHLYPIAEARFTASEKRVADCIGGQGELPFKVGPGYQARVADFRSGARFVTLDYSDGERPVFYDGVSTTLGQMKCQLLRDDEQIKASAGKYRGKVDALDCPSCGSAIKFLPGVTTSLVCPACAARLDASGPEAQVLAAGEKVARVRTTLELGAVAKISGSDHTVIGAMVRADDENTEWTEYLVYNTRAGFFWLVETADGWFRANVLDNWPNWQSTGSNDATLDGVIYRKKYDYAARVKFAAGAFNWRVAVGDQVRVLEFENGNTSLAAELSDAELTWSRSTPVAFDQVRAWFGAAVKGSAPAAKGGAEKGRNSTAIKFMWWVLGLNAIPLLFNFDDTLLVLAAALFALFYPPAMFRNND